MLSVGPLELAAPAPDVDASIAALLDAHACARAPTLLVNNAGHAEIGPLQLVAPDAIRKQLEVDIFGSLAFIRAFSTTATGIASEQLERARGNPW